MRWNIEDKPKLKKRPPRIGDTRLKSVFLFFPATLPLFPNGTQQRRWWERCEIVQRYDYVSLFDAYAENECGVWKNECWAKEPIVAPPQCQREQL